MEIHLEPYNLQVNDNNIVACPCCNNMLIKEIKKKPYLIGVECRECRGSNSFPQQCRCKYGEKDCLYITCEICKMPECVKCKTTYTAYRKNECCNKNCSSFICNLCIIWETKTFQERMNLYTSEKLKILAKYKKIKGYSKYTKKELISMLSQLVNETDIPRKYV